MYDQNDSYLAVVRRAEETVFFTTLEAHEAKVSQLERLEEIMATAGKLWYYFFDLSITRNQCTNQVIVCVRSLETSKQMQKRCFRMLRRALMASGLAQNPMCCELHVPLQVTALH